MAKEMLIDKVRPLGGSETSVLIGDGRIKAFGAHPAPGLEVIDGGGQLLLPGLVEAHTHVDKTLWGLPWMPCTGGPTLADYIENERQVLRKVGGDPKARSKKLLEHMVARGSTHVRSHTDVHPDVGTKSIEDLLALKEELRALLDLQIVAFPQQGLLIRPGTLQLMEEALKLGADALGGIDPAGIDGDPMKHLEAIFNLAAKYARPLDIHLHDKGPLGFWTIERICDLTERFACQGKVIVSHAYALGSKAAGEIAALIARLRSLDIAIMSTAPTDTTAPPMEALYKAGVTICSGSDGVRDAWSPLNNGDMLERAFLLAYLFDWSRDEQLAIALHAITDGGAKAIGLKDYGLKVGDFADLVLLEAETIGEAIVMHPQARQVFKRGRLVAEGGKIKP